MSHRLKTDWPPAAVFASSPPGVSAGAETRVRQFIAHGKFKAAVEAAKEIHKAAGTSASEALLVDAYAARIESLKEQNLPAEATALLELVRERYPAARERLKGGRGLAGMHAGVLEDLLRPLNDPELSVERRTAIEETVRREAGDLEALAGCAALPPEHPLRQAAAALQHAFLAVTSAPVAAEALELPEVSRRSPLAAWKLLIRAIGCFYRGEDASCRRYLDAIQPGSAPARLVPAMEAMLGGKPARLTPAACALVSSAAPDPGALRKELEALERAFQSRQHGMAVKSIREAVAACRTAAPDQLERLKQHISVRSLLADLGPDKAAAAMGGHCRQDAYYLRLFARALEEIGSHESLPTACGAWAAFRDEAVREGWFAANGPEAAALYLHMAGVLQRLPHALLTKLQNETPRKRSNVDAYFLYPEKLYERACALDPHSESFVQWMEWAKRGPRRQAERVAEAWHKIRPADMEPILYLMEEKERRRAFQSSLEYLAKAERIDSVHPAVRRARLRLLAGGALRRLQQNKPHLAEEDLAAMAALPQSRQGDRPGFLEALRYMLCAARGQSDGAAAHRAEVERLLGKAAAALLIFAVAEAAKQRAPENRPALGALGKGERAGLPEAVVRVVELAKDLQLDQPIPGDWLAETAKQFERGGKSLDAAQLKTLGAAARQAEHYEFAYAVSAAGLALGGATEGNFLLERALALPEREELRRAVCASAAAQLGRQHRDMEVVEQAVEAIAESDFDDLSLTAEQVSEVLREEKAASAFPTGFRPGPDYSEFLGEGLCDCPECRRSRGEEVNPYDFDEDGGEDGDADLDAIFGGMDLPPEIPPDIAKMIFAETTKAVERGESLDSLVNRLFGPGVRLGKRRKQGRRR